MCQDLKTNQNIYENGDRLPKGDLLSRKGVRHKKDTKTEILNGAINLFSQKGYTETSMREIALEAKILPGSIYNHFKSKQEILDRILNDYAGYINRSIFLHKSVEKLKSKVTLDGILECMSLTYPENEVERYRKMLYIILHEQHRIDSVRHYVVEKIILENERYVKGIVDMLLDNNLIEPVDSDAVAKLHVATIYFWSNANLFGIDMTPEFTKSSMSDTLRFLFSETIKIRQ
jgi:AcrR family transcriptional regulator